MSKVLKRQLQEIREAIMPKPTPKWIQLIEPGRDASAAEREKFENERQAAKDSGANVIIRRVVNPPLRAIVEDGATIVGNDLEEAMIVLAGQTSECGNQTRLDDVMRSLRGNVLGVSTGIAA